MHVKGWNKYGKGHKYSGPKEGIIVGRWYLPEKICEAPKGNSEGKKGEAIVNLATRISYKNNTAEERARNEIYKRR